MVPIPAGALRYYRRKRWSRRFMKRKSSSTVPPAPEAATERAPNRMWGRTLRGVARRGDGGNQRLHRLRPQALCRGHRGLDRPCDHAGGAGNRDTGRRRRDRGRPAPGAGRDRGRRLSLRPCPRRHPHERRGPARRADRPRRRPPAHRTLAQRPGHDRPPALAAGASGPGRRRLPRPAGRAHRPGRGARGYCDAGLYPPAGGRSRSPSAITCSPMWR